MTTKEMINDSLSVMMSTNSIVNKIALAIPPTPRYRIGV